MAPSEILSQTLHSITVIKFDQLSKQKNAYEEAKHTLLHDVDQEPNPKRTKILVEGAKKLPTMTPLVSSSAVSLANIGRFLTQAEFDPSLSPSSIESLERALRNELDVHSEKYRFAELYGKLVNEWVSAGTADIRSDSGSDSVPLGRAEMHLQRATWEEYVFSPKVTDTVAIKSYLEDLFTGGPKHVQEAFKSDLTNCLHAFQASWGQETHFDDQSLGICIRGLLRSDLLTDQKRATLQEFLGNKAVLREVADVLNMRMQNRKSWAWDTACPIEQRRSLNGRYRFYPDEDLMQSIFLYYIGRRWGVEIRKSCGAILHNVKVMKPAVRALTKEEARRRKYFLGPALDSTSEGETVYQHLESHYNDEILLDQLPTVMDEQRGGYNDNTESEGDTRKSPVEVVQKLLRILQATILLQRGLGREIAVVRSDFKWFGPSLPHSSIFTVLEFFGVEADWIDFFRRALECPLRFEDHPVDAPVPLRRRGLPLSTPIADFLAESLLFCLDFAVNQKADGARLYRLHDDMWLFDTTKRCSMAWSVITEFIDVFGLDINEEKTGSAVIRPSSTTLSLDIDTPPLPEGDVTWGFLKLDPLTGQFHLDQSKIDTHITELRLQLSACRSVFEWIQAWNTYGVRFFSTNFGAFANCYTRCHVDSVLQAFQRIQVALFPGGAAGHLRQMLVERFGAHGVPDGYLFYPIDLGGLGLLNPFIEPLALRDAVVADAETVLTRFHEQEAEAYRQAKEMFESVDENNEALDDLCRWEPEWEDLQGEGFMSFEEFTRHRERRSGPMAEALQELLKVPEPDAPQKPQNVVGLSDALDEMNKSGEKDDSLDNCWGAESDAWSQASTYDQWVCVQHAEDIAKWFGGVTIVEKGLLPMGLMDMLRQSRFKWQT
ncbi:hypothetical protein AUP68_03595 [Ilyonectria robusta]